MWATDLCYAEMKRPVWLYLLEECAGKPLRSFEIRMALGMISPSWRRDVLSVHGSVHSKYPVVVILDVREKSSQ